MTRTPWTKSGRELAKSMKAGRRRLALSIRQSLKDGHTNFKLAEADQRVIDEERRLLEAAFQLLMEPGEPLKERMTRWEREVDIASRRPLEAELGLAK